MRVTDNEGATKDLTKSVNVGTPPNVAPTADFSISPGSPKTLENVTFESTSTDSDGAIVSYGWELDGDNDFNDHTASSLTKVFSPGGTYTIALKVTDNSGDTHIKSKNVVIANRAPTADFSFAPAAPKKNENVTFTSLATDPENRIQMLEWDLDGDNQYDDAFGADRAEAVRHAGHQDRAAQDHRQRRWIAHGLEDPDRLEPAADRIVHVQPGRTAVRSACGLHLDVDRPGRGDRRRRAGTQTTTARSMTGTTSRPTGPSRPPAPRPCACA